MLLRVTMAIYMKNIVTKIFWNYINAGQEKFYVEDPRIPFINGFSLILLVILIAFGFQRLFTEGQEALVPAMVNFSVALILIINLIFLRKKFHAEWASSILSFCVVAIAGYVFIEGATGGDTGILWVYPIPTLIFFLSGKKAALRWSMTLVSLLVSIMIVAKFESFELAYSITQLQVFLFPLLAIIAGLYVYAKFTELNAQELEERTKYLRKGFESEKSVILATSKKKEDVLKEELDTFFNTTGDIMAVADPVLGKFLEMNPAGLNTLGYTKDELLKKPFMEMVHPDDVTPTQEVTKSVLSGVPINNFINRNQKKDGTYTSLMWNAVYKNGLLFVTARVVDDMIIAQKKNEERMKEIENLNRLMVGREVRMVELKEEIASLKKALGETEGKSHL
jgi:PAS domain S-box-containing protein